MRALKLSAITLVLVATVAPASALPGAAPSLESVSPTEIPQFSPDTLIQLRGSGFLAGEPGPAPSTKSQVFVDGITDGDFIDTTFIDSGALEAVIPAHMLDDDGTIFVGVLNVTSAAGVQLLYSPSEFVPIEITRRAPVPVELDVYTYEDALVGSCEYVDFQLLDEDGYVMSAENTTFTASADDLDTPAPNDAQVTFYTDFECDTPVTGPFTPRSEYDGFVMFMASTPQTITVTIRAVEPDLKATTDPIRIAGGWLSGRVLNGDGAPIEGARVFLAGPKAYPPFFVARPLGGLGPRVDQRLPWWACYSDDFYRYVRDVPWPVEHAYFPLAADEPIAVTGADGRWESKALAPSDERIYVLPPEGSFLAAQWYPGTVDAESATPVALDDGEHVTDVDVTLPPGGTISGTVTAAQTGGPLGGTMVQLMDPATERVRATTTVEPFGDYLSPGMPAGEYLLRFVPDDDHVIEFHDGALAPEDATPVTVTTGNELADVDATIERGAVVSGWLSDDNTGDAVTGVVTLFDLRTGAPRAQARPDGRGVFRTSPGLPPGEYRMRIDPYSPQHPTQWYDGATSFATGRPIQLSFGEDQELDIYLERGATFTGTVRALAPTPGSIVTPIRGALVGVRDAQTGELAALGCADENGTYTTNAVPDGEFKLQFEGFGPFADKYYPDAPSFEEAETISVRTDSTYTIDAVLKRGAQIRGRLTGFSDYAYVFAVRDGDSAWRSASVPGGNVGIRDNMFTIEGLAAGTYRLFAQPSWDETETHPVTWYPGTGTRSSAHPITVGPRTIDIGRDFEFAEAGFLETAFTDADGERVGGLVEVLDPSTGDRVTGAFTYASGEYERTLALHPGEYTMRLTPWDQDLTRTYADGASTSATSTPVAITAGETVEVAREVLGGQRVTGTVRAAHSGAAVPYVPVRFVDAETGEEFADLWGPGAVGDLSGAYRSPALLPGSYKVVFEPDDVYAPQWWFAKPTFETADVVEVPPDGPRTGIDALLTFSP